MAVNILALGVLLWVILAISVAFHAKGHNRSGIIWFFVVGITGIFGFAFYLLAITSTSSIPPSERESLDPKIIRNTPLVIAGLIGGLIVGFVLSTLLFTFVRLFNNDTRIENFYWVVYLSLLAGSVASPLLWSNRDEFSISMPW